MASAYTHEMHLTIGIISFSCIYFGFSPQNGYTCGAAHSGQCQNNSDTEDQRQLGLQKQAEKQANEESQIEIVISMSEAKMLPTRKTGGIVEAMCPGSKRKEKSFSVYEMNHQEVKA